MKYLFTTILLIIPLSLGASPPDVKLPNKVAARPGRLTLIRAETTGKVLKWVSFSPDADLLPYLDKQAIFSANVPGEYRVLCYTAAGDEPSDPVICIIVVEGTPPVPPGPTPPPVPPVPPPVPPSPAPIPTPGLHVLILYDSSTISKLPAPQQSVLYAKEVRDYLNSKCALGPDGKTHEWRVWDSGVDASGESTLWQTALKRPHASLPWIIVSNADKGGGFEGPLPGTVADMMTLLKKYGE